jgi:hypothetical protein
MIDPRRLLWAYKRLQSLGARRGRDDPTPWHIDRAVKPEAIPVLFLRSIPSLESVSNQQFIRLVFRRFNLQQTDGTFPGLERKRIGVFRQTHADLHPRGTGFVFRRPIKDCAGVFDGQFVERLGKDVRSIMSSPMSENINSDPLAAFAIPAGPGPAPATWQNTSSP